MESLGQVWDEVAAAGIHQARLELVPAQQRHAQTLQLAVERVEVCVAHNLMEICDGLVQAAIPPSAVVDL